MCAVVGRLFLFVLLACDWAADPALLPAAVRGLAAPLASTECFCHSAACRAAVLRASTGALDPAPRQPAPPVTVPTGPFIPSPLHPPLTLPAASLLDVFLALRC
jgi:hypothetical protein